MKRVNLILEDAEFAKYMELNAVREKERRFCRHDYQHVLDVARVACIIFLERDISNSEEIADWLMDNNQGKEVVYAAGLLHDIGRWRQYDTGEDHALTGSILAGSILDRAGFNTNEKEAIIKAIASHRKLPGTAGFLERTIYKADKGVRLCSHCPVRMDCYKYGSMDKVQQHLIY